MGVKVQAEGGSTVGAVTGRRVPQALRVYLGGLLAFWGLSVLPLVVRWKQLWSGSPMWLEPPFFDFGCYYDRIKLLHRPEFWTAPGATWNYPAPGIFVYQLFYAFNRGHGGEHQVFFGFLAYLVFTGVFLALAAWGLSRALVRRGVHGGFALLFFTVSLVLSWPVYFNMERGNIEFFLDAGIALGLWAYMRRRWWVAAMVLGIFGAGKIYPLLFLSLFLPARRWREFVLGLGAAAAMTVFATHWIGPAPVIAAQAHGVGKGIHDWIVEYSLTYNAQLAGFDHSMFVLLKRVNQGSPQRFAALAMGYAVVAAVGMVLLFFGRMWKMPRPNQLLMVSVAAVMLPPTSFDYTLCLLIPVWAWLVLLSAEREESGWRTMVCFVVLFAPLTFAAWGGGYFGGQVKLLALLGLLGMSAWRRIDEREAVVAAF